jgi:hypothetical protein
MDKSRQRARNNIYEQIKDILIVFGSSLVIDEPRGGLGFTSQRCQTLEYTAPNGGMTGE